MKKIAKLVSVAVLALAVATVAVSCKSKEQKAKELGEKAAAALQAGDMETYQKYVDEAAKLID